MLKYYNIIIYHIIGEGGGVAKILCLYLPLSNRRVGSLCYQHFIALERFLFATKDDSETFIK